MTTQKSTPRIPRKKFSFAGDVLKLVTGTTIAETLTILAAPLLTRLYAPDAWGLLVIFMAITGILGVIACLRYELSIVLPEKDEEAANLFGVSLMFAILIALLAVPLIYWGKGHILRGLNAPGLGPYLWLVPIMIFVNGFSLAFSYWNTRTRHFGRLSIARITGSSATIIGKLGFGYGGYATAGTMIGASVAGQAIATTVLGGQIWKDDRRLFLSAIRWRRMREGILRHKNFPLLNSWAALMNTLSVSLPALILAAFFSPAIVGFFALGHRLLQMPMSLIGGAIAQVFFQRSAEARHEGTLHLVVSKTFNKLLSLGMFPLLLVMIAGKELFAVIFGSQWAEAGLYAQILAPWVLFQFISSPLSTIFAVLEKLGFLLFFNAMLLATRAVSLLIGGYLNNIIITLVLFSCTGAVLYLWLCLFILKKSGVETSVIIKDLLQTGSITILAISPVLIVSAFGAAPPFVVVASSLSLLIYYIILYFRDAELQKLVLGFVGGSKAQRD